MSFLVNAYKWGSGRGRTCKGSQFSALLVKPNMRNLLVQNEFLVVQWVALTSELQGHWLNPMLRTVCTVWSFCACCPKFLHVSPVFFSLSKNMSVSGIGCAEFHLGVNDCAGKCVWIAIDWPFRVYPYIAPGVSSIGFKSSNTLTRVNQIHK